MNLSIVIVNYNGERTIKKCLDSVFNSSFKDLEVIVVDSNSKDSSLDIIKNYKVNLIKSNKNLGFAEGNNVGIKKAKGEYVFLLNNDAYLEKDCLKNLMNKGEIVGPKIKYYNKDRIWSSGGKIYYGGFVNHHYNKKDVDYISGCAMLIKRSIFDEVGLFDKDYFMYYEDLDLCTRIKNKGYKIFYEPKAVVYHDVKEAKRTANEIYYMNRNRVRYCLKFYKFKRLFKILDILILYQFFVIYQIYKNIGTLKYLKEIIKARVDSL